MKGLVYLVGKRVGGIRPALVLGALLTAVAVAEATPIPVGSGVNKADVQIDFGDGSAYVFEVSFDGSKTGMQLLDVIEAHSTLTTVQSDFGWGLFLDGVTYDGHSNVGYGGGDNWWHYWVKSPGQSNWQSPAYGAATRVVTDGSWDGWVYGRATAPAPEPATAMLLGAAGLFVLRRSRQAR
jgi:hypothetical protein